MGQTKLRRQNRKDRAQGSAGITNPDPVSPCTRRTVRGGGGKGASEAQLLVLTYSQTQTRLTHERLPPKPLLITPTLNFTFNDVYWKTTR